MRKKPSTDNISSISEENAAAAEEVSASTEEMSAQVEEMAAAAQSLATNAEQLREAVAHFNLGQEGAEVAYRRRQSDWQAKGMAKMPSKTSRLAVVS